MRKENLLASNPNEITNGFVTAILTAYKIAYAGNKTIVKQLVELFREANLDKDEVKTLIRNAKNASILLAADDEYISSAHLKNILETMDKKTIEALSQIYKDFFTTISENKKIIAKDKDGKNIYESKDFSVMLKNLFSNLLRDKNNNLRHINEEAISNMQSLMFIYKTLKPYLPDSIYDASTNTVIRYADEIVKKISTTNFLQHVDISDADTIKEICETLTNSTILGNDSLNQDEFKSLIVKTSTILYYSSKEKILALRENIENYKEYLLEHANSNKDFEDLISKNLTFKNIVAKAGKTLTTSPETQKANFLLLTGSNLGESVSKTNSTINGATPQDFLKYRKMKVDITPEDLYNLLVKSPSTLSAFNPTKLFTIGKEFDSILSDLFDQNEIQNPNRLNIDQFPIQDLVTGKNLKDLIEIIPSKNSSDPQSKNRKNTIAENILTLNKIMDGTQIFKIMQNNIKILTLDPSILKNDISKLISDNQEDHSNFDEQVNEYVNRLIKTTSNQSHTHRDNANHKTQESSQISLDPLDTDDTFEVKTDYFITEEDIICNKINECFQKIYRAFNYIENNTDSNHQLVINSKANEIHRNIKTIKSLISRLTNLDPKLAKAFLHQLELCKVNCNNIIDNFNIKLKEIATKNPIIQNGKEYNKQPDEYSLYSFIQDSKKRTEFIEDEEQRNEAFKNLVEFEKSKKDIITKERRQANADRIDANERFVNSLPQYSALSVAINELNKILGTLNIDDIIDEIENSIAW